MKESGWRTSQTPSKFRADHDPYRQLTQCDGVLRWVGTEIKVHLVLLKFADAVGEVLVSGPAISNAPLAFKHYI